MCCPTYVCMGTTLFIIMIRLELTHALDTGPPVFLKAQVFYSSPRNGLGPAYVSILLRLVARHGHTNLRTQAPRTEHPSETLSFSESQYGHAP